MYHLFYDGEPVKAITMRGSGVSDLPCCTGWQEPAFHVSTGRGKKLAFEDIEKLYALLSFLSLCGYEVLRFEIRYLEVK